MDFRGKSVISRAEKRGPFQDVKASLCAAHQSASATKKRERRVTANLGVTGEGGRRGEAGRQRGRKGREGRE